MDASGEAVEIVSRSLGGRMFRLPDEVSEGNLSVPVELTPIATEFARLFTENGMRQLAQGSFQMSEATVDKFRQPAKYGPLTFHFSEMLLEIGRLMDRQIVAKVDHSMIDRMQSDRPTLGNALVMVFYSERIWKRLDGEWITLGSVPSRDVEFDRNAIEKLVARCNDRTPTLDELAQLAANAPMAHNGYMIEPYLRTFFNQYGANSRSWLALRAYNTLSTTQRRDLRSGKTITYGALLPVAKAAFKELLYDTAYTTIVTDGDQLPVFEEVAPLHFEITEALPNGIPDWTPIRLEQSISPAAVAAPKSAGRLPGVSTTAKFLGIYSTSTASIVPNYEPFWAGEQTAFGLLIGPSPEWCVREDFTVDRVDKTSEPKTMSTAPKAFKDAYEKSVAERNARRGGGGGLP